MRLIKPFSCKVCHNRNKGERHLLATGKSAFENLAI
jgi:hypothetical protein